ncbi:hypothetical protein CSKR_102319 [Clonorchis sinensis]|uniref:Uncharacterized protein n=1 Tax=Clonorchis sinensis TaxID=79923 RepID=A0A3R7C9H1_CLOSI|nr:hypothetical protein CSKR_102319 [Clonorchis sinensis]
MKGSIKLLFDLVLLCGIFSQGTGLSLIKNENDVEIPKEKEVASDDFERGGDESASLAAKSPDQIPDEDFQEITSIASEETESHSAILGEAKENSTSQGESPSDQLQDGENATENVPASLETEEDLSTVHQTEVVSPIQDEDSTVHGEADQVLLTEGTSIDPTSVGNQNGHDIPDSGPTSSPIQQEDGGAPGPVVEASGQDEAGQDTTEIVHAPNEINEIPTRPMLDENESCRQNEGPIFHDLSSGFFERDTQVTEVTDMRTEVSPISEQEEYPNPAVQQDAGEQDVESASPGSQQLLLSLFVLPLAVLAI